MPAPARAFLVFALGYFVSYLFRGVNLVLAPLLTRDIGVDAAGLGVLTSVYLLAFAGFQLPLGILLDRYGPRRVEAGLLAVAATGALVFAAGHDMTTLMIGRALIGIGVSACLVGAVTALALWFPLDRLTTLNGAVFALGGLGGAASGTPVELALRFVDWRVLFVALAAFTLAVAALLLVAVPEHRSVRKDTGFAEQWNGIRLVFQSRPFWIVAIFAGVSNGVFLAVQGLWAGPFMRDVQGLDERTAAGLVVVIALAMVAGGFALGWVARHGARNGITPYVSAGVLMTVFMGVQLAILLGVPLPVGVQWTFYGFFGSSGILGYAVLGTIFPPHLLGRVGTAFTLATFACAFLFQTGFGAIIDGALHHAARFGAASPAVFGHVVAWSVGLVVQSVAAALYGLSYRRMNRT